VSFNYLEAGKTKALEDISLEIAPDDFIALIGPLGSGKTTLLKLLVGLLKPTQGEIIFDNAPLPHKGKKLRQLRRRVGMVFQFAEDQVFEATVKEEIAFALINFEFPQNEIEKLSYVALETVGFNPGKFAHKSPFELSGGERKRLAIASILAFQPQFLLLDEPAAGLDFSGKEFLRQALFSHHHSGRGAILVTHDLDFAMEICTHVIALDQGKVIYDGDRSIYYEVDKLKKWNLHPPELVEYWLEISQNYKLKEKVYSVSKAIEILKVSL
jgi:energy-coupling factor transport system ATP-binding protein